MAQLLEGIRILDLTVVWAGPYGTQLLADLGAEVIRIESTQNWQIGTRGMMARPPKAMVAGMGPVGGGYPDQDPGPRPWNRHALFNCHARNKHSFTVDLNKPEGKDIVYRLARMSDVFVENNQHGTVHKLGLDYDSLKAAKPDIIYLSSCGLGQTGVWKDFVGFGLQFEAIFGHTLLTGYPDMDPSGAPSSVAADGATGPAIASAVIAALHHRNRTGQGQFIDLSQGENFINHLGEIVMDYTTNGRVQGTLGNRQPFVAPQGCYPCLGEDEWIVITIASDEEWRSLCQVMGRPELAQDPRFADMPSRWKNHDELDELISEWTRQQRDYDLFHRLQRAGVVAGPVIHEVHAYNDPHLKERGFFVEMTQAECGTHRYPGALVKFSETPIQFRKPLVRLGEDNEYVYRTLLGLSDAEYAKLEAEGHIGMDFRPDIR